jgi:hypothetical protein
MRADRIADRIADLPPVLRDALGTVTGAGGDSATPGPTMIQQAVLALLVALTVPPLVGGLVFASL